ncbi:30S ribosomal protein S13 [Candidatus Berkelbacteria bacterium CG10_big_fil_rev_8_21_14_0_10_41_12]|uniref:Small ribosomal subunit protein uS13 n=1 Tax=Candidatus Berkelbacteria bacterium CG10_big_fil_rev_8_21_14_0_10_41_12 TaxID=1974513 RepID=A0A2M6WXQ0_9BACT|nr:MAG: 30S ribosomal protein S13 [Candidatus Berkelbacteria bacterium CG10_big_fil_rev_8_21_14_0_10_41_12]
MARIAGVNLPNDKRIEIALMYIMGIGASTSGKILDDLKIDRNTRTNRLNDDEVERIRRKVEKLKVEGDLRIETARNIKRLKEIGTYVGTRHAKNLPVRGQRTKTNARTKRGKRVTVGSGRKKAAEKT